MHWSTYCGLKKDEKSNKTHISFRKEFDNSIRDKLGPYISPDDFLDVNLEYTPLYEMYENDTTDAEGGLAGKTEDDEDPVMATGSGREVPTLEFNDNDVNSSAMLPRGNIYARGKIIGRKRYADGNASGRENYNPIVDTREYRVEFTDGEVSELTKNMIEYSMYAA